MNILFSCDEYPPAKTGGIGNATKTVAEALALRGHKIYVVSGRLDKSLPEIAIINGVTIYRMYLMQKVSWLFRPNRICSILHNWVIRMGLLANYSISEYYRKQHYIEQIVKNNDIQIVELPDYTILSKYYASSKLVSYERLSVPTIARVHGSISFLKFYRDRKINSVTRINDKEFFESVDRILSVSHFAANFVKEELGVNKLCDVIYNPLVSSFLDLASSIQINRSKNIVFLGKIIPTKGAFNLIKAFNKFSIEFSDYNLIMIGGGQIDECKSLVDNDKKKKVYFTGYLNPREIAEYLKSAAFCVIPSFFENFSVAALEVMGFGNILIYTKESSGPELINDGVDGFLVNPYDINDIVDKMIYVANNIENLEIIRNNAKNKIEACFSEEKIINQLENYYINLINNKL